MIVDSSALIAILYEELGHESLLNMAIKAPDIHIPASVYLEASIVAINRDVMSELDNLIVAIGANILPFTAEQAAISRDAYRKYGKGQRHPAQLNFGDCMVYAAAKVEDMPLLFTGGDFAKTDVRVAGEA